MARTTARRRWTDADLSHLRQRVSLDTVEQLAVDLGRSTYSVNVMLSRLGLFRLRQASPASRRKRWGAEEDAFLTANRAKSISFIAAELDRSESSVTSRIRKLGLDDPRRWTLEEDRIVKEEYESNPNIRALLPGRSWPAVVQRATKVHHLHRRCGDTLVNEKFFDEPLTKEAASVLGFFTCDGHLLKTGNGFSFSQADRAPLEKIAALMNFQGKIQEKKNRREHVLSVYNGRLTDQLRAFGYDNRKTYTAKVPRQVTPDLYPSFFGRFHEGDGSIGLERDERHPTRICGYIQFLGTREVLEVARKYFIKEGVSSRVRIAPHGRTKTFKLKYKRQRDVISLIRLLYPPNALWLTKKYKQAMAILEQVLTYRARARRTPEHNRKIMLSSIATRGKSWPDLIAPDGTRHRVLSTGDAARQYGLSPASVWAVLAGTQKQTQGWTRAGQ